nr:hypothetical protein [Myxococcota bacterium]
LVIKDRRDHETERFVVLAADEADGMVSASGPIPALRTRLTRANGRLVALHALHDLRPLTALATAAPEAPVTGTPRHARGADLAITWDTRRLTIRGGVTGADAVLLDTTTPTSWLVADRPMCAGCPETCSNPAFLRAAHADAARAVAVLTISYGGTDLCWEPSSQHHVVSW